MAVEMTAETTVAVKRATRIGTTGLVLAGITLMLMPFISTWRLGNDVLAFIPDDDRIVNTESHRAALFDGGDFVLATVTYRDVAPAEVASQLANAGFTESYVSDSRGSWRGRTCCGSYDAALTRIVDAEPGVTVQLSVLDNDIASMWILVVALGALITLAGLALGRSGARSEAASRAPRPLLDASVP